PVSSPPYLILKTPHPAQRGQSLVEFAVSSVVLLLLVGGLVDIGRSIFITEALSNAAREGARHGAWYDAPNLSHPYLFDAQIKAAYAAPDCREEKSAVSGPDRVRPRLAGAPPPVLRHRRHRARDLLLRHHQPRRAGGCPGRRSSLEPAAQQRRCADQGQQPDAGGARDSAVPARAADRGDATRQRGVALHHRAEPTDVDRDHASAERPGGGIFGERERGMQRCQPRGRQRAASGDGSLQPRARHADLRAGDRGPHRDLRRGGVQDGILMSAAGKPGGQSGQAIVLIAIMLTVLIGMTAIAIDGA